MSIGRITASVLTLLVVCASPAFAEDAPRNTPPFSRFKMVLNSGVVNSTLPFDVPYIIWGDVIPARADLDSFVTVYLADAVESDTTCSSVTLNQYRRMARVQARRWEAIDYEDRNLALPGDLAASMRRQYELLMPPLQPSRLYCMLFEVEPGRALTPGETDLLVSRMTPAYRAFLEAFGSAREVPASDVEGLRQQLIAKLLAAAPLEGFRPDAGSVFNLETTAGSAYEAFVKLAAGVLQPHANALLLMAQLDATDDLSATEHAGNVAQLGTWIERPDFRALEMTASLEVAEAVRYFASLNARERSNVLLGRPVGSESQVATTQPWEPATLEAPPANGIHTAATPCPTAGELAGRCSNLETSRRHLAVIQKIAPPDLSKLLAATSVALDRRKVRLLSVQSAVNARDTEIGNQLNSLRGTVVNTIRLVTTTMADVKTRRTWYLSADAGLAVAPSIGEIFPYAGINIYFRPVNNEAPPGPFLTRFAALVGFTWTNNLVKPGERRALWGDQRMLLFGAGIRVTEVLRLTGGALILRGVDRNPLIDKTRIEATPFVSVSADIDVQGMFAKMFGNDAVPPK